MRDIKFRAWDNEAGYFLNDFVIDNSGSIICFDTDGVAQIVDAELMQFTGLQDMNGVDIYEGDIVRCYTESISFSYCRAVEWDTDRCDLGITNNGRSGLILCKSTQNKVVIVGNIHKNPELMELLS